MTLWDVLKRPILTEKATKLQEMQRCYVFEVDPRANKALIKQAVEKIFNVKVKKVRTVRVRGKRRRLFTRHGVLEGRRANRKKAYVTLQPGYEIDIFGVGVQE